MKSVANAQDSSMEYVKIFVAVTVYIDERGNMRPLSLFYNGRQYDVDKVVDVRKTPPEHVGGLITRRYDCVIRGKVRNLFRDIDGRWFIEGKRDNVCE